MNERIGTLIEQVYGAEAAPAVIADLTALLERWSSRIVAPDDFAGDGLGLTERDTVMIAYGDSFPSSARSGDGGRGVPPLANLLRFLSDDAEGVVSGVHVLPFSPYSSDDGFSVIDYRQVNPDLGGWEHLEAIADEFKLMADLVLNHCSAKSEWFAKFLAGEEPYNRYFITVEPGTELSSVVRPRALPLLTEFETVGGTELVWTTFSADQVDLNFAEPAVLIEMLDVFLGYIARGARIVRLDAIAYLWKEIGHPCIHHPKTHAVVKLMRAITDELAPWVVIITETNVPHEENLSYFGNKNDEAQMVYNFSLPPLTLDAFIRGSSDHLQTWAATLPTGDPNITFFNFLASHDGIGLLPARGILTDEEIESMIETVKSRGGRISYKATPAGDIPYEMNVNYLSAIVDPALPDEQRASVFLAAQSIMLCMAGVPGIYYHSLIGSQNWIEGVEHTGANRTINRQKLVYDELSGDLAEPGTLRNIVFEGFKQMIRARAESQAFHPAASARVLSTAPSLFAVLRSASAADAHVLCLVNVSDEPAVGIFTAGQLPGLVEPGFEDMLTGDYVYPTNEAGGGFSIELEPYEVLWLQY